MQVHKFLNLSLLLLLIPTLAYARDGQLGGTSTAKSEISITIPETIKVEVKIDNGVQVVCESNNTTLGTIIPICKPLSEMKHEFKDNILIITPLAN